RCTADSHCGSGYSCDLNSLRCVLGSGSCTFTCHSPSTNSVCVNNALVQRPVGAACNDKTATWCGNDNTCSPLTLKCTRLGVGCDTQPSLCGGNSLGLNCVTGGTCACTSCGSGTNYAFCFAPSTCSSDAQ